MQQTDGLGLSSAEVGLVAAGVVAGAAGARLLYSRAMRKEKGSAGSAATTTAPAKTEDAKTGGKTSKPRGGPQLASRVASDGHAMAVVALVLLWLARNGLGVFYDAAAQQHGGPTWHPSWDLSRLNFGREGVGAATGSSATAGDSAEVALLTSPDHMLMSVGVPDRELVLFTVALSVGYFLSDTLLLLTVRELRDPVFVFHHLVIGGGFSAGLVAGGLTSIYHFLFLAEELSTIFMNARWRRIHEGASSAAVSRAGVLFAFTYFAVRVVCGNALFVTIFPNWFWLPPDLDVTERFFGGSDALRVHMNVQIFLCVLSRVLNMCWAALILQKVLMGKPGKKRGTEKKTS